MAEKKLETQPDCNDNKKNEHKSPDDSQGSYGGGRDGGEGDE